MLVNLNEILIEAEKGEYAVAAFNSPNLESLMAIIEAAEEMDLPVVIQHAQVHETVIPVSVIGPIMVDRAKKAKVPVCIMLDHGETFEYIQECLDMGFTGIMYDGSALPYEENVANTKRVVEMCKKYNATVEGELGSLGKRNTIYSESISNDETNKTYTNPDQAKEFVEETGVCALACSFGTTHGFYIDKPVLNTKIVSEVHEKAQIPVVMHGGSGLSEQEFTDSINSGVRKVNYYTYMAKAGADAIKEKMSTITTPIYFHEISNWGLDATKEHVESVMKVFYKNLLDKR